MRQTAKIVALALLSLLAVDGSRSAPLAQGPGKGPWKFDEPEKHGLDTVKLDSAAAVISKIGGRQGLVIVRDGVIVYEKYWASDYHRAAPDQRNVSFSSGKSWGSAMVGIAVKDGALKVDDLVSKYVSPVDSGLRPETTLRDLLTMSSGGTMMQKPPSLSPVKLGETPIHSPGADYRHVAALSGDEIGAPAGYGVSLKPGTLFWYDGAASDHISDVVAGAVRRPTHEYIVERLMKPLGVENLDYQPEGIDPKGNIRIGGSIELSVRDMARLGQLWLDGGAWDGAQLVDAGYVKQSIMPSALNPGYGFLWWLNGTHRIRNAPASMYYAAGAFGQYSFVLPELNMVVATMGFDPTAGKLDQANLIWDALGPALVAK